ncbi:helix-turn-helix transcriptional regulator [Roseibium aestuarii]|uniref:AraC family transcriptional regulator n=1 Tax=Roseibium aestuarii TaxID=2600299 RepID=A0ABW4JXJ5_9HYPH|nr:AraC family transcriptional regulator [Roseibium aestuarii]
MDADLPISAAAGLVTETAGRAHQDRLSTLISNLRVDARLLHPRDHGPQGQAVSEAAANFVIQRLADGAVRLVYTPDPAAVPSGLNGRWFQTGAPADGEAEVLVRAQVALRGVGPHLVRALPPRLCLHLSEAPDLASVIHPLIEEATRARCGGLAAFLRLCEVVLIRLLRHCLERAGAGIGLLAGLAHPRLAPALVAIHDRPERAWNLEDLAEVAGMSRTQFAVTFREVLGVPPGGYLADWRLALARLALQEGEVVRKVARSCGFSSTASFSRAFTRRYGLTPSQFRRSSERDARGPSGWIGATGGALPE